MKTTRKPSPRKLKAVTMRLARMLDRLSAKHVRMMAELVAHIPEHLPEPAGRESTFHYASSRIYHLAPLFAVGGFAPVAAVDRLMTLLLMVPETVAVKMARGLQQMIDLVSEEPMEDVEFDGLVRFLSEKTCWKDKTGGPWPADFGDDGDDDDGDDDSGYDGWLPDPSPRSD